ncbi:RimK/LysX family protein [Thalassotalea ponticola]|uniref:ATP-dependent zinc protease family protein n=1 Tax=Thalassotalea ponticola TaxID=1523392 RepID=UPI0025B4E32F|nr:RimK/LysX family protein [Thalassotalea ponticola]MDN3652936.1 RimK/LysX family protein [Thalassotalea ponticola]
MNRLLIGNIELCSLPDLGISDLPVRIDTGAKTSSLHVDNINVVTKFGKPQVNFDLHPDIYNLDKTVKCSAPLHDSRRIKSSNGVSEQRCVIITRLRLGIEEWPIELTLSNREEMTYMMLLGRQGMGDRVYVDPSATFLIENT